MFVGLVTIVGKDVVSLRTASILLIEIIFLLITDREDCYHVSLFNLE